MTVNETDFGGDLIKSQRKGQRGNDSQKERKHCLTRHHGGKAPDRPAVLPEIHKENDRSADDEIDRKIPEIRKAEVAGHKPDQYELRLQKNLFRERFRRPFFLFRLSSLRQDPLGKRVGDRRHRDDKENIDIVRVEIAQNRRVGRILVNRLIRKVRIISDISGRIREPVAVFHTLDPVCCFKNNPVDHIMEIPAETAGKSCQNSAGPRNPDALLKAFPKHLIYQRERQAE